MMCYDCKIGAHPSACAKMELYTEPGTLRGFTMTVYLCKIHLNNRIAKAEKYFTDKQTVEGCKELMP